MPEGAISTGAGNAGTGGTPSTGAGVGAGTGTGAPPSTAEPKIGWAGQEETRETGIQTHEEAEVGSPEVGEFGDETFGDEEAAEAPQTREDFGPEAYQQLKQALAANPELFKQVKRAVSENKRFKEIAESPEILRQSLDRLESLGGLDSVEQESQEWNKIYDMFATGDKGVAEYWSKEAPEGFSKAMPDLYNTWQQSDPAGWTHDASKTFMATVHQSGLAAILESLSATDNPEQKKLVDKAIGILNAVNAHAERPPTRDLTPEQQKLDSRAEELSQKENALYQQSVSARVVPILNKVATNALNAQLKGRKLTADQRKDLMADINREYSTLAKNDADFQKNAKALLSANETEKFLKLVSSNMERTMPLAARRIWRKYTGISGLSATEQQSRKAEGQSLREAGGGGTSNAMVKTAPPNPREVDWQRLRDELGRDKADEAFSFGLKGVNGGKRFYYKKGDKKTVYTF